MWGMQEREEARIILRLGVLGNWIEVALFINEGQGIGRKEVFFGQGNTR